MYEPCTGLETEFHTTLSATDVYLFDVIGLGEVFHVRRAVEDCCYFLICIFFYLLIYVACDITIDDEEAGTEEFIKTSVEIVEEQVAQTSLRIVLVFSANKTSDGLGIRILDKTGLYVNKNSIYPLICSWIISCIHGIGIQ